MAQAELDENTCRKDFLPSEYVAIGELIEQAEVEDARKRQAHAGPADGRGRKRSGSGNFPEPLKGRARDKVASAVGVSGKTYEKAKSVVAAAEAEPEKYGKLVEQMDRTGKVDGAFKQPGQLTYRRRPSGVRMSGRGAAGVDSGTQTRGGRE